MSTELATQDQVTLPFTVKDVKEVTDNGGVQYEAVMTGGLLQQLHSSKILQLKGNIRPEHNRDKLAKGNKTRKKIDTWTQELLDGDAVIGNLSIRLNPDTVEWELDYDAEGRHHNLIVDHSAMAEEEDPIFDLAVDSESRIKAILAACENPFGDDARRMKFAVRIWMLRNDQTEKVAVLFNTRGDKVNDSTAKFRWAETNRQELARRLVKVSPHLGTTNVEVMANSVSANSPKLCAFNTISKALERRWVSIEQSTPDAEVESQAGWLISAWASLVRVRPEFGSLSLPDRQAQRRDSVSSTAVVIAGMLDALATMHAQRVDPAVAFRSLAASTDGSVDVFSWQNQKWVDAGVVIVNPPEVDPKPGAKPKAAWTTRNSYAARDNAARVLKEIMGLAAPELAPEEALSA